MDIRTCTPDELLADPDFPALIAEYGDECAIDGIGRPGLHPELYRPLIDAGLLHTRGAYLDGKLVGFIVFILHALPHYAKIVGVSESFFVASAYRKTGAGLGLLREFERVVEAEGGVGTFITAPEGGKLEFALAASRRYANTNTVWFRKLGVVATRVDTLPSMNETGIGVAIAAEEMMLQQPQVDIPVTHALHGGMYHRTIMIPAGVALTGALIRVATLLIIDGDVEVFTGSDVATIEGRQVMECQPHRKQVFLAHTDTHMTMVFPTKAATVEDAENEMTIEAARLQSRQNH